ncbi:MAG: TonB-dependent receptor [Acidobacteria bacterium]|nr:TonB-dependent receptor [Acidobacteriota bacterium]
MSGITLFVLWLVLQAPMGIVRGTVADTATGAPLPRVLVSIEGTDLSTQTDRAGRFELLVPHGSARLFVSVVGYALQRRELVVSATPIDLTIALSEGTGTYTESVTVAADRFVGTEPAVAAQHLLGSADLQNLRGVLADDPLRAVQVLPGVVSGDDLRSDFTVRASPFSHINMTVDGFSTPYILHTVRAVEDYSASGSVAMINSDILQDVALLSGGYPQRFGNRTGAEINFRLREGSRDRTHALVAVSGTNASAVFEGPLGKSRRGSWLVSARQSYIDLIIKQIDPTLRFGFSDAQAKLAFDLTPAQRFEVTMITGRSRGTERQDGDADAEEVFTGRNASGIAIAGWHVTKPKGVFSLRTLASTNSFSNTAADEVRIDEGRDRQAAFRADGGFMAGRYVYLEGGAIAEWTGQRRVRQRSISGAYRPINNFSADALRSGGYVQARVQAGRVTVVPGLRVDHWSLTSQATLSPWVQAQLPLAGGVTMRAGAGIYQQFPDFEQTIGALAAAGTRPQRAGQFDLGFEQRIGSSVRWQITLYDREESDFFNRTAAQSRLVNDRVVPGSRSARFTQSLDGFARGIEVLIQRKAPTAMSGWVSYSFSRNRYADQVTGESFYGEFDQRHTLNIYGSYRKSDRVSFSTKARIGTNVPAPGYFTDVDGTIFLSAVRNDLRMPVYARVDVRANRTFNWSRSRLTLFAEIMNVLNRDNVRFVPPGVSVRSRTVRNIFERMIPIVPSLGVLIEF